MKATAERLENNQVTIEVEVDAEQFTKAMDQAYRKLVGKVTVPGFRKGKTPRVVFENFVGKATLYNEAVELVVPDAYMKAVKTTGVEPVSQPQLDLVQVEEGKPVVFKATVRVKPDVKLGQYTGLQVTKPVSEVTGDDIENELKKLQERHARLNNLEEGTVQQADIALIDFVGRKDGVEFEGGAGTDYSLEIGSGSFVPGFEDQLAGVAIGETREVTVTFPEDYPNEDLKGQEAVFTVTVKGIKRKETAALDDEFAKDVSEFDTLEELRADLSNKLKEAAEKRAQQQINGEAVSKAVENAEVDIPDEMIETRLEEMIENMERRLMQQGMTMENYFKYTNSNLDDLKKSLRDDAARGVKTTLVLETIAKQENIEVSDEDLQNEIARMAENYQQEPEVLRKILEGQNQLEYVRDSLQQQKTIEFIAEKAELVEGTNPEEAE
ncbi:trigger factor [Desulfotomaculum arcticum]|uniref:Trigger factor n=1 Tax=Desulfotruncus arcticus DSM 17038 TaxID=1121424 RepID=A0A1I2UK43_9FIRM|nr:trigger factor [Desulfotruncus arcticus]SFG76007.1 trigger factor [Desulfotomaculum arcticum] [Desulfotruncus arcticus DSM 17038]